MSYPSPRLDDTPDREPLRLKLPERQPIVTYALLAITILFYIFQNLVPTINRLDLLTYFGGNIKGFIMEGQFWRFFTPALLHGSIMHIVFNMYALLIFGRGLEKFYGHGRFLLLYILSAFAGNVLSFVLGPAEQTVSIGASTAIFGLLSAQGVFIFQNREIFGRDYTRQALMNMGLILFINLSIGFSPGTNIDNMGHIGGLIGGIFFAWKAGPLLKVAGQAPLLSLTDARKKGEVLLASLVVFFGFAIIAANPFLSGLR